MLLLFLLLTPLSVSSKSLFEEDTGDVEPAVTANGQRPVKLVRLSPPHQLNDGSNCRPLERELTLGWQSDPASKIARLGLIWNLSHPHEGLAVLGPNQRLYRMPGMDPAEPET